MKDSVNNNGLIIQEQSLSFTVQEKIKRALTATMLLAHLRGDAHVVSCIGTVDILCNLLSKTFNFTEDVLILSKGHASLALYSSLYEFGLIDINELFTFRMENSKLGIHAVKGFGNFSRLSSGSLGHGIGFGAGIALAKLASGTPGKVYVIVGDGELNEGSNFEAMQIASVQKISNLVVLVDHNEVQSVARYHEISAHLSISQKFQSFGWDVSQVGNESAITPESFLIKLQSVNPKVVVCFTSRFPHLPDIQNQVVWHYRKPSLEELELAIADLGSRDIAKDILEFANTL